MPRVSVVVVTYNARPYLDDLLESLERQTFRDFETILVQMRRRLIFRAMESAGLSRLAMTRFGFFPPFLANRPFGARLESVLERVPLWRPLLPFQLFRGDLLAD